LLYGQHEAMEPLRKLKHKPAPRWLRYAPRIEAQDAIIASHAETKNKITPHQLDEPTTRRAPARFQQLPPVSSLDSASAQALIALASAYPGGTERERLISHMGVGFMVGEQVLEGWAGLRLIEYRRAAAIRRWI